MGRSRLLLPRWGPLGLDAARGDRRRARRVAATLPVFVYGRLGPEPFAETTETMNVSSNGGFLLLSVEVIPAQTILLTNSQTGEEVTCRVTRTVKTGGGKVLVGLQFLQVSPQFWRLRCADGLA